MNRKHSARRFYQVTTAVSLALLAAGCATNPLSEQSAPNYDDQVVRAQMLIRYCDKLTKSGDLAVAASICQRAYETNPSDPTPLYSLAMIYKGMGATEQAGNVYRTALMMNPDDFDALYGLAKTSIDLGKYEEAESQLERALQVNDQDPRVYNALGVVKDQLGQHDVAQALYRTGLLIDPANVPLRNNLGLSLALTGEQMESIEILRGVAGSPGAGNVSSQNLALASTYKVPKKPSPEGDGPIEIRTAEPGPMAAAPMSFTDGDKSAAAKAKPLHKEPGKPAAALAEMNDGKAGKPVSLGSATGTVARGGKSGPSQELAAGIPTEFLASNDHTFQTGSSPAPKKVGKKARAKSKKAGSKATNGSKIKEYRVQLGAYRSEKRADKAWEGLLTMSEDLLSDLSHFVIKADTGTELGTVYRLRAGPLENRAASNVLCAEMKTRNLGCFVVEVPKDKVAIKSAAQAGKKVEKMPLSAKPAKSATKPQSPSLLPPPAKETKAPNDPSEIQG